MANLIITIIGIALLAVVAITAVMYLGSDFTSGQAKATANALVSQAQQIAAAWQAYSLDQGGSTTVPYSYGMCNPTALAPNYIDQFPQPPSVGTEEFNAWVPIRPGVTSNWLNCSLNSVGPQGEPTTFTNQSGIYTMWTGNSTSSTSDGGVCLAITQMAHGPSATLTNQTNNCGGSAALNCAANVSNFDCFWQSNAIYTGGNYYSGFYFFYRVFN